MDTSNMNTKISDGLDTIPGSPAPADSVTIPAEFPYRKEEVPITIPAELPIYESEPKGE